MAYKKKEIPKKIQKAQNRLVAMKTIDTDKKKTIDYGKPDSGSITVASFGVLISEYTSNLDLYNQLLQKADALKSTIAQGEKEIGIKSAIILESAPYLFGDNSSEVVELGGKKKIDRKKPKRKTNTPPIASK
jgi:hypothetical protein